MTTFLSRLFRSSVMMKIVMAVSGLGMIGFLAAHLTGNLFVFAGPEKINAYARGLQDLGPALWALRLGVLTCLVLHVWSAIALADRNRSARPIAYKNKKSIKSTLFSRSMMLTGVTIFAFVIFHLLHYTFGLVQPEYFHGEYRLHDGRMTHDAYSMIIHGFQNPFYSAAYSVFIILAGFHLAHAITSVFQTLGMNNSKYSKFLRRVGPVLATIIAAAYLSIPSSVMMGLIKQIPTAEHATARVDGVINKEIKR